MPAAIPIIAGFTGVSAAIGAGVATAIGLGTVGTLAATAIGSGIIAGGITAFQGGDAGDVLRSAVLGGATSYIGGSIGEMFGGAATDTLTDAQFIAADAAQLAQQGLGAEQIAQNLTSYGVNESLASQIALDAFTGMGAGDIAAGYATSNLFNATAGMGIIKPDGSRFVIPDDWNPVSTGQGWVDSNGYIFDATGTMVDFAQYPTGDWLQVDANGVATINGPTNLFRDVPQINIAAPTLGISTGAESVSMLRGSDTIWNGLYDSGSGQYFDTYGNPINSPFNTDTGMQVVSNSTGEVLMSDAIATGVPTPEIVSTPLPPAAPVIPDPMPQQPGTGFGDDDLSVFPSTPPAEVPVMPAPMPQQPGTGFGDDDLSVFPSTPPAEVPVMPDPMPQQPGTGFGDDDLSVFPSTPPTDGLPPVEDAIPSYVNPNPPPPMTLPEAIYDVGGALVDRYGVTNVAGGVLAGGALLNNAINPPPTVPGRRPYAPLPPLTYGTGDLAPLVNPGLNPGQIRAMPYYQTTDPVQSQYYWGQRPYIASEADLVNYNVIPDAPAQPFGIRQSRPALDVPQFIRQNINPTTQAAYMGTQTIAPVAPTALTRINPLTGLPYTEADLVAPVAP